MQTATYMPYRPAVALLNRMRHERPETGTPMRTAAEVVEREGTAMQAHLEAWADQVLDAHAFTPEGQPQDPAGFAGVAEAAVRLPQATVENAIARYNRDKAEAFRIDAPAATAFYEDPAHTINVSIDDVGVKKQKTGRRADSPAKAGREYVHHTIAHVEAPQGRYLLNGLGTEAVLRLVVAFFLQHEVLSEYYVQFFVDGARTLHAAILTRLATWLPLRILLDWYHLQEKCKLELSLALRGAKLRNAVLADLWPILWLGRVDEAIAYLRTVPAAHLKPGQSVDRLIGYFERNRAYIPCYALRKALHLRNSSNRGEKANDLCVAGRQKHQGMSWTPAGSVALTTVTTLHHNHAVLPWCTEHTIPLQWVA